MPERLEDGETRIGHLAPVPTARLHDGITAQEFAPLDPDEIDGETGPDTKLARIYLAAHAATIASNAAAGASGPLTGRSAGGLSETFSAGAPSLAASYGATAYGQALAALLRMHTAAMPRVL